AERHDDLQPLIYNPQFLVAAENLTAMGYPENPYVLVEEMAAHIAEGRHEQLGLSRDEAVDWMEKWFKSFADKHGDLTIAEFRELADEAEDARKHIYERNPATYRERGQPGQDVSKLQEGRS